MLCFFLLMCWIESDLMTFLENGILFQSMKAIWQQDYTDTFWTFQSCKKLPAIYVDELGLANRIAVKGRIWEREKKDSNSSYLLSLLSYLYFKSKLIWQTGGIEAGPDRPHSRCKCRFFLLRFSYRSQEK